MEPKRVSKLCFEPSICVVCGFSFIKLDTNEKGEPVIKKFFGAKLRLTNERISKLYQLFQDFDPKEIRDRNGVCISCYRKVEKALRFQQSSKEIVVSLSEMRTSQGKSSDRVKDPFFSENLLMNLRKVYKELILCDTELMCNDGVVLKAHWLILAFHSDYLRKLAVSLKSQNRMVKLDIESCVMETLLEYCYEGSFDVMRVSCEKLKAAASFLQFKEVLEILETAVPACKNPPKQLTTSHHNIPSSVKKVKEKTLYSQIQTPFNTYNNAVCVTSKKQLPIVVPSLPSAEPKPMPVTLHQETDPNQTEMPKTILVNANQPSVSSVSIDINSTNSQCHMSNTTNLADQTATKIPFSQMNKNPPVYVVDVFKQKSEKIVGGKKRILLPKPDTQPLHPPPSTPPAPSSALVPLKVTQPSGKGVPLLMLTSPTGQVSLHQIRDTQSKGPIISNVVGSQVERWSNDTDADNVSSLGDDHGQAKRRRASVVDDDATSNELDMISPRSIYFDSKNNHYLKTRTRIEDTLSQEEDNDNVERLKIKIESMDEYDDSVESGVGGRTAFNGRRIGGEEFQEKEAIEESFGIKVETIDDPELEPYTVYVRSPGSVAGEAPGDQDSDCESLEQDLCDVGTVHVKTEFDMDSESDSSNDSYPTVTFQRGQNAINYKF